MRSPPAHRAQTHHRPSPRSCTATPDPSRHTQRTPATASYAQPWQSSRSSQTPHPTPTRRLTLRGSPPHPNPLHSSPAQSAHDMLKRPSASAAPAIASTLGHRHIGPACSGNTRITVSPQSTSRHRRAPPIARLGKFIPLLIDANLPSGKPSGAAVFRCGARTCLQVQGWRPNNAYIGEIPPRPR